MKRRFWIKLSLFLLIALAVFLILEVFARQMYASKSDMHLKKAAFEKHAAETEILFLGNSHIEKGIDPSAFSKSAFNLAYSNQDMYYDLKLLQKNMDKMPNLKVVVEGLSLHSFGWDEASNSMYYVKDYFFDYGIVPRHGFDFMFFLNSSVFWLHRTTIIQDYSGLRKKPSEHNFLNTFGPPDTINNGEWLLASGYRMTNTSMSLNEMQKHGKETASREIVYYNPEIIQQHLNYLEKMYLLCKERNILFVLVTLPVSVYYRNLLDSGIIRTFDRSVSAFMSSHPDIPYYDFRASFDGRDTLFYNGDHLNLKGARIISKELDSQLLK